MENNTSTTTFGILKAAIIEIAIILILTSIVIFMLNFLKIIDIYALFARKPNFQPSQNAKIKPNSFDNQRLSQKQNYIKLNPAQPDLNIVSRNKALHMAQNISEFEGKIITIDLNPEVDTATKASISAKLVVGVGKGSESATLLYPTLAMDKIKVVDSLKKVISLKDLRVGDKVTVRTNTGTLRAYPNNINQVLITKQ